MKSRTFYGGDFCAVLTLAFPTTARSALEGEPYIHDPSTDHVLRRQVLHLRHRRWRADFR